MQAIALFPHVPLCQSRQITVVYRILYRLPARCCTSLPLSSVDRTPFLTNNRDNMLPGPYSYVEARGGGLRRRLPPRYMTGDAACNTITIIITLSLDAFSRARKPQIRLAAGLRPDSLGELERSPRPCNRGRVLLVRKRGKEGREGEGEVASSLFNLWLLARLRYV